MGLGSGSTVAAFLDVIAESEFAESTTFVPSSIQIERRAVDLGLEVGPLRTAQSLDVAVDGADEVDTYLNLVKGGGGALVRERVVAELSGKYVVLVDESKLSEVLGKRSRLPVEVLPEAMELFESRITAEDVNYSLRADEKGYPRITENGNVIYDLEARIEAPAERYERLVGMAGVVDAGLFVDMVDVLLVGRGSSEAERRLPTDTPIRL